MDFSFRKAIGGALLVGGTAIGAGMLALPVVTGAGGFFPAIVIFIMCWFFSACTGLLLLEVCLWMPNDANIISMAHHLLGPVGKILAWVLYLFLFYCLTIAYSARGGSFVVELFGGKVSHSIGVIVFTAVFGTFVYLGTRAVDRINFLLMIGLGVSYLVFVFLGIGEIKFEFFKRMQWFASILALPVMFTSFSYQGIIPSLTTYLDRHPKMIRFAILVGTSLPFIAYIVWNYLILGLVPAEGPHGLVQAEALGYTAVEPLKYVFLNTPIHLTGQFFSAFALTTSFLGVTLGLVDFLSDGFQLPKVGWKKILLCVIVYVPPVIIATINPYIFLKALGYAGGVGCALLLGLFPIIMVWIGRYYKKYPTLTTQLPGGKILLALLGIFVIFELLIELTKELMY
ncbi:MAG: aromatic amino acid transport family protein [Simkaniaceae bacterium]|nr:aromatic amino acid transport family protein [Simkaniaceae bacterium]